MLTFCLLALLQTDPAARLQDAIRRLDADDFRAREEAAREIAALPSDGLALVEAALKRTDLSAEVRTALERALPPLRVKALRLTRERKQTAYEAWNRRTLGEAYEAGGRKDPNWDSPAREALRVIAFLWANAAPPDIPDGQRHCYDHAQKAVDAGCDDPLVLYVRARTYEMAIRKDPAVSLRQHLEAARALQERGAAYHPARRAYAYYRAGQFVAGSKKKLGEADRAEALGWLRLAADTFAEGLKDPDLPDALILEFGEQLATAWLSVEGDRAAGADRVAVPLEKERPKSNLAWVLRGRVYTEAAWDARGRGWASSVTEEGWKGMAKRLAAAEEALAKAHAMDPADPEPPTQMLVVELGQGKGADVMEAWFRKAMIADPDNMKACNHKMYYLEPKWHGSPGDMLAFGRELLEAGNWEARLPYQLIDAHLTLAGYQKDQAAYWKADDVWKDVQAVYLAALKRDPKADFDRSWYARLASWCGRWKEAKEQFDLLGERAVVRAFKDQAELDRLRAEAAEKGK